ncbi:hypothetical protein CKO38_16600 [Rhodospirillum rubrum]|uniref:hypothetical protein n=1 Tax=Rhodospirillum rubrum TaxID=1085 RepID=UPI001904AF92|nr:hypothetical protein [Rhodospirillum rubrum]MBK1663829.1 hypothetical protein [Rhodospirillum rubrum]MBK1678263.1 hypothetical protein [Rhodospirillum rubrum]
MTRAILAASAAIILAACAGGPATATPSAQPGLQPPTQARATDILGLETMVAATLPGIVESLGIPRTEIEKTHVTPDVVTAFDVIVGADTWVWLKGRPGTLVVSQDSSGYVRQIYTTDGLTLPGVRAF